MADQPHPGFVQCRAQLKGMRMVVGRGEAGIASEIESTNAFLTWLRKSEDRGEWIKEKDGNNHTLLLYALHYKVPDAVTLAVLAAWPGAVEAWNACGVSPLRLAQGNLNKTSQSSETVRRYDCSLLNKKISSFSRRVLTLLALQLMPRRHPHAWQSTSLSPPPSWL